MGVGVPVRGRGRRGKEGSLVCRGLGHLVVKVGTSCSGEKAVKGRLGPPVSPHCPAAAHRPKKAEVGGGCAVRVSLVSAGVVGSCGCRVRVMVLVSLGLAGLHQRVEIELVGVALPVNFRHDVLVIVVPKN